jgi:hypothetical protein
MKLSNETMNILKNFSTINSGLFFKSGKKISTVSPSKTILAEAVLTEEFPKDFGIYDLNNFLSVLTMSKDAPEIDFDDHHVIVKSLGGRGKLKYRITEKSMIVTPPDKTVNLPSIDVSFELTNQDYEWIMKSANVLQLPNVAVLKKDGKLRISAFDASNDAAHDNSIDIGDADGDDFKYVFKTDNLKMIPGIYQVEISSKGIAHFKNVKDSIEYWVATEK